MSDDGGESPEAGDDLVLTEIWWNIFISGNEGGVHFLRRLLVDHAFCIRSCWMEETVCLDRTRVGDPWRSYDGICKAGGRQELTCVSSCLGLATNFRSQSKQQGGSRDNGEWSVGDCDRTGRSITYYRGPPPRFDLHPTRSFYLTSMVNVGKKQKLIRTHHPHPRPHHLLLSWTSFQPLSSEHPLSHYVGGSEGFAESHFLGAMPVQEVSFLAAVQGCALPIAIKPYGITIQIHGNEAPAMIGVMQVLTLVVLPFIFFILAFAFFHPAPQFVMRWLAFNLDEFIIF